MDFGEPEVFPKRERTRFRDSFGHALLELRSREKSFRELEKGPWALFIAIAVHWQTHEEAWPSQESLARFNGWSSRAVRTQAGELERGGFVRLRRERQRSGAERIFYAPGPATLTALVAFAERFPRQRGEERPSGTELREAPEAASGGPAAALSAARAETAPLPEAGSPALPEAPSAGHEAPEAVAAGVPEILSAASPLPEAASGEAAEVAADGPPEAIAEELRDQETNRSSSSDPRARGGNVAEEEQAMLEDQESESGEARSSEPGDDDRELARMALAERLKRKYPEREVKTRQWFAADELELVARCSHAVGSSREAKQQALLDAIEAAFAKSKRGAPSVSFIWGTVEHFLDHADRGKRRRIRADLKARAPRRGVSRDSEEDRKAREYGLSLIQAQLDAWKGKTSKPLPPPSTQVPADQGTRITTTNDTTATNDRRIS